MRQPYAELIVNGRKTIELRKWNTSFRGKFLIHASKYQPTAEDVERFGLKLQDLTFGALIGTAELTDVRDYEKFEDVVSVEWLRDCPKHLAGSDYLTSTKGFVLKNAKRLAHPIPYKGQLNFFDVDDDVVIMKLTSMI